MGKVGFCFLASATLTGCLPCKRDFVQNGLKKGFVVSAEDQEAVVLENGAPVRNFKISTSKFGLGDAPGSYKTPLGRFKVVKKIGYGAKSGTVFKGQRPTGELVEPNQAGRDAVVSRILWLKGLDSDNRNAFERLIYIHGTPEEKTLGQSASYGCVRMSSKDVIELFEIITVGSEVRIVPDSFWQKTPRIMNNAVRGKYGS
jgi:hypothetical protein